MFEHLFEPGQVTPVVCASPKLVKWVAVVVVLAVAEPARRRRPQMGRKSQRSFVIGARFSAPLRREPQTHVYCAFFTCSRACSLHGVEAAEHFGREELETHVPLE